MDGYGLWERCADLCFKTTSCGSLILVRDTCSDCCNHTKPLGGVIWMLCNTCFQFAFVYSPFVQVVWPCAISISIINPMHYGATDRAPTPATQHPPQHPPVGILIYGLQEVSAGAACHRSPIKLMRHNVTALVIGWAEDAVCGMFCHKAVHGVVRRSVLCSGSFKAIIFPAVSS